ncbi:MAG TPA: transcriptional regulator [Salinimicrobium catena]|uniref:Transcriptional regulator n=1 Tax=Salinimicrobium catena TaxID=390640 RepID=A0A7C2M5H7_9FLAO|nr:transcriptional regulator [Salinimicrobium catena]
MKGSVGNELLFDIFAPQFSKMELKELDKEKAQLTEKLGVLMERKYKLAPVAARILSTLILSGKPGLSFDELVKQLQASKSTVSTNLEHLQKIKRIGYYTMPGDRKRYFKLNANFTVEVIDEMINAWETEKSVNQEILQYKEKRNTYNLDHDLPLFDLDFQKNLLVFLEETTAALKKLKTNFINKKGL